MDLDFAMRTAPHGGLVPGDHDDIVACKEILVGLAADGHVALDDQGWPKRHQGVPAIAGFELLGQHGDAMPCIDRLHDILIGHGIWVWKRGAIEAHLGISKTAAAQMAFIENIEDEAYIAERPDYAAVAAAMAWLRE